MQDFRTAERSRQPSCCAGSTRVYRGSLVRFKQLPATYIGCRTGDETNAWRYVHELYRSEFRYAAPAMAERLHPSECGRSESKLEPSQPGMLERYAGEERQGLTEIQRNALPFAVRAAKSSRNLRSE